MTTVELVDVWCSRCPAPATTEKLVTAGSGKPYRAAYCALCAVNVGWSTQAAGKKRGKL